MGFTARRANERMIALKDEKKLPNFVGLENLLAQKPADRQKWLKDLSVKLSTKQVAAVKAAGSVEALIEALANAVDERASPRATPIGAGVPYLQPTDERRRSGSHYTPRSLTEPIVRQALEPAFERIGPNAAPEEVLSLKVLDPACGSGAFLVEACRQLGARLEQAWDMHKAEKPAIPPDEDEVIHARRLVAQRCLYGVDRNPMRKPHDTGLMTHAHLAFVKAMAPSLKSDSSIAKLLDWLKPEGVPQAKSGGAAEAIAALLSPWQQGDPPAELRAELTMRLTGFYGDPRALGGLQPWNAVPEGLVRMVSRWLTGQNIQFFMDVVSEADTDPMFPPRRKFWMKLHQEGRIDDAWVALSVQGASIARRRAAGRPGLAFGHQTAGGSRTSTCLLILKIGRKIVVEGSHSYQVHVFDEAAPGSPKLRRRSYDCEEIRLIKGSKAKRHLGDWQSWVRENI